MGGGRRGEEITYVPDTVARWGEGRWIQASQDHVGRYKTVRNNRTIKVLREDAGILSSSPVSMYVWVIVLRVRSSFWTFREGGRGDGGET